MKDKFIQLIKNVTAVVFILGSAVFAFSYTNIYGTESGYPTDEQAELEGRILAEMKAAGYTYEQSSDEIYEQIGGIDGPAGTGGKDGLLLDGTPAPNAPGNPGAGTSTPKCDHSYKNEVTKEATCTATGTITYTCEKCGKTYTEKIPKLDHDFEITEEVIGTCLEKGYRVEVCKVCGLSQTVEGIYGDHDLWVNGEQKEPACTEPGLKTEQCKLCMEVFTTEIPALGHEFETTLTVDREADCVTSGEQSNHCARCGERTNITEIPVLGHDIVTEEKEAGIFTNGYEKSYCARCGYVKGEKVLYSFVSAYKPFVISGVIVILGVTYLIIVVVMNRKKKKQQPGV